MTTQAAAVAPAPANGGASMAVTVKHEASPQPDGKSGTPAAAAAATPAAGSRGSTPAADGAAEAAAGAGAGAADAAPSKEDEEQRKLEDEILAEGQAIAGVRALLAKAFSRPWEEPAAPRGHWGFLLQEAQWLANDMAQERLWKQAAALAVGWEVARLRGKFGLKPPPEGQRRYHDEIVALRAAAAKEAGAAEKAAGRRGAKSASAAAVAEPPAAAALKLDPADDPIFKELTGHELALPGTPPNDDLSAALTWQHDDAFQQALAAQLMQSDIERIMREEMAAREYRFEYDAALASHHMAVQEQSRRAMRLDADMADAEGLVPMDEDMGDDEDYAGKKAKGRKRARSGYLLDDFHTLGAADETESVGGSAPRAALPKPVGGASSRQYIEDTYLQRKRRRERYKDVDVDYDVGMEAAGRYGTRANRALATRAGATRAQDPRKKQAIGRADSYAAPGMAGGAMMRGAQRVPAGSVPGPVIWSKSEDDLLLAITHEFGVNWTMVSEVLSLSLSMQGIFRPPHLCKQRFRQITTPMLQAQAAAQVPAQQEAPAVDYTEEKALMALYMAMTKQQAREILLLSLPVLDDVMMRMLEALVQVGATAKQRRQQEERRNEQGRCIQEAHPSHQVVHQQLMQKTGGKHLTPQELAVQVDVAYAQQAKQQQMMQQQAQQAAQLQQAAAPPPPGQQGGAAPPAQGMPAPGPAMAAGTPAVAPGLSAGGGPPQQGMPSAGTPPLQVGPGMAQQGMGGAPGSAPQQLQQGMPQQGGAPGGAVPSPAGVAGHPGGPRPQPHITLQQLNHILETGKLPNGQPLEPQMRKAIEDKKNAYLSQMAAAQQRQMAMQAQMQGGGAPGGQPGGMVAVQGGMPGAPSAASQAAMQAAQQAAAMQAGMRPAMPMPGQPMVGMYRPTLPGQPMPGQPMQPGMQMPGLQPGMQMGGMQMPGMPGMQQQYVMQQQYAMQQQQAMQQQAAAAAAAQQPGQPGA